MIAFAFSFPAARYHATPWGRHANEADVAWPPEPVRLLRALIATWWRKGDRERFPKEVLDGLVDTLAAEAPLFHLPDAVHSHTRAFMPAPDDRKLIYDAFLRFSRGAQMIVVWPNAVLTSEQRALAAHLLERLGYLGRAESWAEARVADAWQGPLNCCPRVAGAVAADTVPVEVTVSLTPKEWAEARSRLAAELQETKSGRRQRALVNATLPAGLADALMLDTGAWHKAGWSSPPPLRRVTYDRPPVGPLPTAPRPRASRHAGQPGVAEAARFLLAGRPRPRVEDTLRIAEVARLALMSLGADPVPVELCGRDERGALRDDAEHRHAFYLPEDADGDGQVDHLIVYCRLGFSDEARRRLDQLTRLWLEHGRPDDEGARGRREWRLALEDIALPTAFADSRLLRQARGWRSVTPYLKPRFDRRAPKTFAGVIVSYRQQVRQEWERRFAGVGAPEVEPLLDLARPSSFAAPVGPGGSLRSALAFVRTRGARGGSQPDVSGGFFRLVFDRPVPGPIALGYASHFGLGLFAAEQAE